MNIYVIGFFLTLVLGILMDTGIKNEINGIDVSGYRKRRMVTVIFFMIFWGSILCFRDLAIGSDTEHYVDICQRISCLSWKELLKDWEFIKFPLYLLFNRCVSIISTNAYWYIFVNSLVYIIGILLFLYKNSRNIAMTLMYFLVLHFYFWAMNINRESIAIMLVMWAYHYWNKARIKKGLFFLICAVLVHNTALIGIPILAICLFVDGRKGFKATTLIGLLLCLFAKLLAVVFVKIFPAYKDYFSQNSTFSISNDMSEGNRIYVAIFILILLFVIWLWKNRRGLKSVQDVVFWRITSLSVVGLELMILQNGNEIFARLELYYTYFLALMLPEIVERFVKKESRGIFYCITLMVLFIPFYVKLDDYLPYTTWILKK